MTSVERIQPTALRPVPAVTGEPERSRALIVDDDSIDRRRLKSICDKAELNLDFHEAESLEAMAKALDQTTFEIIFVDYRLQDGDGLRALSMIRAHPAHRSAATIMVAGVGQTSVAVAAVKAGCSDYVLKDALDPNWLRRAVVNALEKSRLRREYDQSEEMRATLDAVLDRFSRDCIVEMKPMLSRMLRQVRRIRGENGSEPLPPTVEDLAELEESCQKLWNFAEKISTYATRYA